MSDIISNKKAKLTAMIGILAIGLMCYLAIDHHIEQMNKQEHVHINKPLLVVETIGGESTGVENTSNMNNQDSQSENMPNQNQEQAKTNQKQSVMPPNVSPDVLNTGILPENIPPAMLEAMKARGMSVEDLGGNSNSAQTNQQENTDIQDIEFPEEMLKAIEAKQEEENKEIPKEEENKEVPKEEENKEVPKNENKEVEAE